MVDVHSAGNGIPHSINGTRVEMSGSGGRFVALLRGVNVGRANRVPMAQLRELLESLGYSDVRTLLNSGNAVFGGPQHSPARHVERIRAALAARLDVDVPVVVKSAKEMAAIVADNPLARIAVDGSRLLIAFTSDTRALKELATLAALVAPPEQLHVGRYAAYLWCANGILESKAGAALLGKAGSATTTRNWATVLKIDALLRQGARTRSVT
jgi:uncharacterized protein (DUF1697 family)